MLAEACVCPEGRGQLSWRLANSAKGSNTCACRRSITLWIELAHVFETYERYKGLYSASSLDIADDIRAAASLRWLSNS